MAAKKKPAAKAEKKATKKKTARPRADERDPSSLLGKTFYFCDPWEWEDEEHALRDEDGEIVSEVCGEWEIRSVDEEDGDVWAYLEIDGHDFEIQLPIDMLPSEVWDD